MDNSGKERGGDELLRFLPRFVVERQAPRPKLDCWVDRFEAALLFADISGFTSLAERLAEVEGDGAERLTEILNDYFGRLIDVIVEAGGDVVKFAGDALLAIWPADSESLAVATQRAAACGLAVQEAMSARAEVAETRLSLRVGIASGTVDLAVLGGERDRWEPLIVGAPVAAVAVTGDLARPGEVAVDARSGALIAEQLEAEPLTGGALRVIRVAPPPPLREAAAPLEGVDHSSLLGLLPGAVRPRLKAGQASWLNELRWVTVLFVALPDLDRRVEVAASQALMVKLQRVLYRYEGSLNKLSVDDKGVSFVAAFGLPPLAHEDDALRGTLAALAVHEATIAEGRRCSIGVATGRVFTGVIGNERRCEYTLMGDAVNLSARLMQAAEGGILCDPATHVGVAERVTFGASRQYRLKGKRDSIELWPPLAGRRRGRSQRGGALVGRAVERDLLASRVEELVRGELVEPVLFIGEAGIGKSRLAEEVFEIAAERGVTCHIGAADAVDRATPYHVWRGVFQPICGVEDPPVDAVACLARLVDRLELSDEQRALAPLLDAVLAAAFEDSETTEQLTGEVRAANTNRLLTEVFKASLRGRPTLLVLEDGHWFDSPSWALLASLSRELPELFVVLLTRPVGEPQPKEYQRFAERSGTGKRELSALSSEESLALACQSLGVNGLPPVAQALIREKAQGNPFFSEQLASAMRDSGLIDCAAGSCVLAVPEDALVRFSVPDTVQGAVTSRIDRLPSDLQLTIKVASVLGRSFSAGLLSDIHPVLDDRARLRPWLEALEGSGLITLQSPGQYQFSHVITREVAYGMLPRAQRAELHGAVGRTLEARGDGQLVAAHPRLAEHWLLAGALERASPYLVSAAREAYDHCANRESIAHFTKALAIDAELGGKASRFERACWLRELGEAHYGNGDVVKSLECLGQALQLFRFPRPRSGIGMLFGAAVEFGRHVLGRLLRSRRMPDGPERENRRAAARAYERVAQLEYINNATFPTLYAAFKAQRISEPLGDCAELGRTSSNACVALSMLGLHGLATRTAVRAQTIAEGFEDPQSSNFIDLCTAICWLAVAEWERAKELIERGLSTAERVEDMRRWDECATFICFIGVCLGELEKTASLGARVARSAGARGVVQAQIWGGTYALYSSLSLGRDAAHLAELKAELASFLDRSVQVGLADHILGFGVLALARWRHGEHRLAEDACASALALLARGKGLTCYLVPAYVGLAEVLLGGLERPPTEGRYDQRERLHALGQVRRLLTLFSFIYPIARPYERLFNGRYAAFRGRRRRARKMWEAGRADAEGLSMPFVRALLERSLAGDPGLPIEERAGHLATARASFEQMGARYELGLCDAAEL